MQSAVLVTGGTGTLGRLVVARLQASGNKVRVLSRRPRDPQSEIEIAVGDLETGTGVQAAVAGVEVIVHCAGSQKDDDLKARTLVRAAQHAGVRHLVYISVVGADRVPVVSGIDRAMFGYFASKLAAERVVAESAIPWTTLRATQFHDLVLMVAQGMAKLPVIPVPAGFHFQPIDTAEVADRLVELALGEPSGLVPDLAGPKVYSMSELLRSYLNAKHVRRLTFPIPLPGQAARAVRQGAILAPNRGVGRKTWEQFLAERTTAQVQSADLPLPA
jgi:uncharacterized protein YbjT (DUF2867 family)